MTIELSDEDRLIIKRSEAMPTDYSELWLTREQAYLAGMRAQAERDAKLCDARATRAAMIERQFDKSYNEACNDIAAAIRASVKP